MSKSKDAIPLDKLGLFNKLIAVNPKIERKGKTMPYTSVNGHMFSFLDKDGSMGLRLSDEDRKKFIDKYKAKLMVQYGRVLKEYVVVPPELLEDTQTLSVYLQKSYDYILTFKPKPGKK
ncbi:hypothetical protein ACFLSA_02750 [Bacteroidota bacterium]